MICLFPTITLTCDGMAMIHDHDSNHDTSIYLIILYDHSICSLYPQYPFYPIYYSIFIHCRAYIPYCIAYYTILCILHTYYIALHIAYYYASSYCILLCFFLSSHLHLLMSITDIPHKPQKMTHHLWQRIKAHIRHTSLCTLLPHNYCH